MAQTGYTPILCYASSTPGNTPSASNLTSSSAGAELAINYADGKLFYKDSGGTVQVLAVKMPSGILPITNGGTNSTATPTAGAVAYGTGTAYAFTSAGTSNQVLISNGSSAPSWSNLSSLGVTSLSFGTTGLTPSTATQGAITVAGTLATTNGGTGLTSFTANGVVYASSTSSLSTGSALTFASNTLVVGAAGTPGAASFRNTANTSGFDVGLLGGDGDNTGYVYNRSTGGIVFAANNTEQMRLTSTGLGIGTSSPAYKLDVQTSAGRFQVQNYGAGSVLLYSNGALAYNAATVGHQWQYAGTEQMRLDSSGNLGLGVTPSAWGIGGVIQGPSFSISYIAGVDQTAWVTGAYQSTYTGPWLSRGGYRATMYQHLGGTHAWYTSGSTPSAAGQAISFTQAMTLDSSGNLGVGTTSPTQKLHVEASTSATIRLVASGTQTGHITSDSSGFTFNSLSAAPVIFSTANTERARIDSIGNLLVGQSSTGYLNGNAVSIEKSTTGRVLVSHASGSASGTYYCGFALAGAEIGSITQNGTTAVAYNTSSDYRLKNITGPITNSGAYIDSLNPVEGTWKADGSTFVGLIAHEVQEASRTPVATGVKDGEQMQGMDYSSAEIIANMIAELKSLRARVAQLEGN